MKLLMVFFLSLALTSLACQNKTSNNAPMNSGGAIINGEIADPTDLVTKSTISLLNKESLASFCTGTLISKNAILTATHCLERKNKTNLVVFFGATLPETNKGIPENAREVEEFKVNEAYEIIFDDNGNFVTGLNDVAIIKFSGELPEGFAPVEILETDEILTPGFPLLLAGYGVINDSTFENTKALRSTEVALHKLWRTLLVTDQTQGHGACAGDSGGPAYILRDEKLVVAGITRGPHNAVQNCSEYGEYTSVSDHKQFILNTVTDLGAETPVFTH